MIPDKERITPGQLMALIIQSQIGVGALFLPSTVEAAARNDSWISILIGGAFSGMLLIVIWALGRRFPGMILFEYLPLLVGKPLAKIVHATYAVMFISECGSILALFADVVRDWIFASTPAWIILGMMLAVSLYLAVENLRLLARFFVLTFGLIFVLVLIALYAYRDAEWLYALPIGQAGLANIAKGAALSMNSFYGFEIILFSFPFVQGGSRAILKAGLFSNLFSTAFYVFLVFTCVLIFTPEELRIIPQPILYMVKALSFTVFERADMYFLMIWIVVVISTVMAYLYMASKSVSTLFGKARHSGVAPFVAVCILLIAVYPHDQDMIDFIQKIVAVLTTATLIVMPLLLLGLSYLRKIERKERRQA
ncbi:GerAB/ArcD/ProY family transporter [Cohnella cellulosilytica]|uniref:GerAB/ArcD/ProY family transporter n=1 Tax=Cohnella cellulosilytica TaxID=986710 RepID=A0ABW2FDB8_9BACL